jgi:Pex14 N-terminal domain
MADNGKRLASSLDEGSPEEGRQPHPEPSLSPPAVLADPPPLVSSWNGSGAERQDLFAKARMFLRSPQIQYQDVSAKRQFLAAKGMSELEIDTLLREQVRLCCY